MAEQRTFRALGGVDQGALPAAGAASEALRAEFERAFTLKASVEGASRLAIRLGLLSPAEVRALWAEAMARGLYDGWDAGQSAYDQTPDDPAPGAAAAAEQPGTSGAPPETLRGDA
jgi:hypothetical protein